MRTGILITARLGSSRLKRKHSLLVDGKPILFYLQARIVAEFKQEIAQSKIKVIIATSDEPENREFERLAESDVTVFYGSRSNIPLRHFQAARAHCLNSIISVDGDDILCSVKGMRVVYEALIRGLQYVKTTGLPFGMNSMGYARSFLETALAGHCEEVLETGWGRILDQNQLTELHIDHSALADLLRFTLDYEADFDFLNSVITGQGGNILSASDEEIAWFAISSKLYLLNEEITKVYWENFCRSVEKERSQNEPKCSISTEGP